MYQADAWLRYMCLEVLRSESKLFLEIDLLISSLLTSLLHNVNLVIV